MSTAIDIAQLRVRYGSRTVLDDLTLAIPHASLFGLVGPNGAGKSTLLRCIAGLQRPDHGRLRVDGLDPTTHPSDLQRRLGFVPQALALYPTLSVAENLRIFAGLHRLRGNALREAVARGLALANLESRHRDRVDQLSGGMARRLNLACSILHRPGVIICDEPTSGIDAPSRDLIFDALRQLNRDGATIVYTTHHLTEIEALCTRAAILDQGRIALEGTLPALLEARGPHADPLEAFHLVLRGTHHDPEELLARLRAAGLDVETLAPRPRTLEDVLRDTLAAAAPPPPEAQVSEPQPAPAAPWTAPIPSRRRA